MFRHCRAALTALICTLSFVAVAANLSPTVSISSPASGLTLTAPASITLSANAADADGTIVNVKFYRGTTLLGTDTSAPYSFAWTNVAAGSYSITAKATDNLGVITTSSVVTVTVAANVAPTVSITSPTAGTTFTAPAAITINANAADINNGTITKVVFYRGTTLLATDTTAPYSYTWTNAAAGSYSITAKATDNTGAVTTSSVVAVTVAANVAPTVSITSPTAGASFTAPAAITINANAADINSGTVTKVDFYRGTTLLGTDTTAPYSYAWTNAAAGSYSITAKATDNSGAVTTSSAVAITVAAPNAVPTVSISSPVAGASFVAPAAVTINATAADSNGTVSKVDFYNGTTLLGSDTTSPYSFAWANVAVGSYSITAKATDNAGAVTTSAAVAITVTAPNAPPTVSISSPVSGSIFTAPAAIAINATAADSNGTITKVDFYNGTTLLGTDTTSPYSFAWANVAAGSYNITAKATDNNGAVTTSTAVAITVAANVAPTVSITAPATGATFATSSSITLSASASDANNGSISNVKFYRGTTLIGTVSAAPYDFVWSNVAAGSYSITAKATDNSGAITTSSAIAISVAAPNTPPTVSLTSPANISSFIGPAYIQLTASAADPGGSISIVEFFNGADLLGTSTTAPYSYYWNNVPLGTYSVTAKATDNRGATTVSTPVNITVKATNVLPTVEIVNPANGTTLIVPQTANNNAPLVTVTVNANDVDGVIKKVELYQYSLGNYTDGNTGQLLGTSISVPYTFVLSRSDLGSSGQIVARVYDDTQTSEYNSYTDSRPIKININDGINFQITNPIAGRNYGGSLANLQIKTTQNGFSKIHYYNDDILIGTSTNIDGTLASNSFEWKNIVAGVYNVYAKAVGADGVVEVSNKINFTVKDTNDKPVINLTKPIANAIFAAPARVILEANAFDIDGDIAKVDYYNGANLIGSTSVYPYSYWWQGVPKGSYAITAIATDNTGATTVSNVNNITVNSENLPPSVNIINPVNGANFEAEYLEVTAIADDVDGYIAKVEFYDANILFDRKTTAPYIGRYTAAPGTHSVTVKATDNLGVTTITSPIIFTTTDIHVTNPIVSNLNSYYLNNLGYVYLTDNTSPTNIDLNISAAILFPKNSGSTITIDKVEIYNESTLFGSMIVDNSSSVSGGLVYKYNIGTLPIGNYIFTVKLTDSTGRVSASIPLHLIVTSPPTISIASPANSSSIAATSVLLTANAADTDGTISKVEFYDMSPTAATLGKSLLATVAAPPYSFNWSNLAVGTYSVSAKAYDNNNIATTSDPISFTLIAAAGSPTVSISNPPDGVTFVAPASLNLIANATAVSGRTIDKVDFYNGLLLLGTVTTAPYTFAWNNIPAGSYSITAIVTDNLGSTGTSVINVYVTNPDIPPTVIITSPASGARLFAPQSLDITADALDGDGIIASVGFYNNTTLLGTSYQRPFGINWKYQQYYYSTPAAPPVGTYNLVALATDNRGVIALSTIVPVTVEAANAPPAISITSPAAGARFAANPATITINAIAVDADGTISKVEFFNGSTLLGASTTAPYTFIWSNVPSGTYSITARATDDRNVTVSTAAISVYVGPVEVITYIHNDFAGSPLAATDAAGNIVWKENYRPFGEKANNQAASADNRQWFHGKAADTDTGLQYFGARYYDPVLGRFMGVDPVGFQEDNIHSFNKYAYGNNNPYRFIDPDGNQAVEVRSPDWMRAVVPGQVMWDAARTNLANGNNGVAIAGVVGMGAEIGITVLTGGSSRSVGLVAGQGGQFSKLVGSVGDDLTAHHIPQAALKYTSRSEGGAIVMTTAEHEATRSFGYKGAKTAVSDTGKSFRDVLASDFRDVRNIVGSSYNKGLQDVSKYYKDNFPTLINK